MSVALPPTHNPSSSRRTRLSSLFSPSPPVFTHPEKTVEGGWKVWKKRGGERKRRTTGSETRLLRHLPRSWGRRTRSSEFGGRGRRGRRGGRGFSRPEEGGRNGSASSPPFSPSGLASTVASGASELPTHVTTAEGSPSRFLLEVQRLLRASSLLPPHQPVRSHPQSPRISSSARSLAMKGEDELPSVLAVRKAEEEEPPTRFEGVELFARERDPHAG